MIEFHSNKNKKKMYKGSTYIVVTQNYIQTTQKKNDGRKNEEKKNSPFEF